MSPQKLTEQTLRATPTVRVDEPIATALQKILDRNVPALPVVDAGGHYAGIFGEREFLEALFPGYLRELKSAAFLSHELDDALEHRERCRDEPVGEHMFTEHVAVRPDVSDMQIAETFIHHHVLVVPVLDEDERVKGLILRRDFFRAMGERFLARKPAD